ncbi:hypothetical protein, partial [Okeania sp. SIO1I7]|uniref:hypothetical protein n=1 Tax=Okeania sp. SIO1I7 TaxID=2607772 RepID=UPI0025D30726
GATVRPSESKSRKAGAMKQKAPNSDARESRAVSCIAASGGCQSIIYRTYADTLYIAVKTIVQ